MIPTDWKLPVYAPHFAQNLLVRSWVLNTYVLINERIDGRIAMSSWDAEVLAQAIWNAGNGDHLELGTLWGGSAILAALVKDKFNLFGKVICIDDFMMSQKNTAFVLENAAKLNIEGRIEIVPSNTHPLPWTSPVRTVLIDADHQYHLCIQDFHNVKTLAEKYIIFHDYDPAHPGVVQAVREAMTEWTPVHISYSTAVLEKL